MQLPGAGCGVTDSEVAQQVEVQAKYAGYIERSQIEIESQRRHEETLLPADFSYEHVRGLSVEVRQKLVAHRPATLGQAARLPGITPAAISLLLIHLKRKRA
jgi:tRNA uridine 5-carboxymethylaminomethyl modification enzyme